MSERASLWLLILALAAQLLLLASQVPGRLPDTGAGSLLEELSLRVAAPVPRLVSWLSNRFSSTSENLRLRETLEDENRELQGRVEELEFELFRMRNVEEQMERLAATSGYQPPEPGMMRPVDVVFLDHSSWLRTLIVYTGDRPAELDQPVLTVEGLVGRVVRVAGSYAKVQLLTDPAAAASVMIERTRRQGIIHGGSDGLEVDFLPLQSSVRPGDRVLTAGLEGIYPRGIAVGTVISVTPGSELFHEIDVAPAVDYGRLDTVYLLERERIPAELKEEEPGAGR